MSNDQAAAASHLLGAPLFDEVQAQQRAANRCRNCGEMGHFTHECTEFGPLFHEEGKGREDYAELDAQILSLIALDIFAEHGDHELPAPPP